MKNKFKQILIVVSFLSLLFSGCSTHIHDETSVNTSDVAETSISDNSQASTSYSTSESIYIPSTSMGESYRTTFCYSSVEVDQPYYSNDSVVSIHLQLYLNSRYSEVYYFAEDGPFYVKITDSPFFDIMDENEQVVEDFKINDADILDFTFKIRLNEVEMNEVGSVKFEIKCNLRDNLNPSNLFVQLCENVDLSLEYFSWVENLFFVRDLDFTYFRFYDQINATRKKEAIRTDLLFLRLNTRYDLNLISKIEYVYDMFETLTYDHIYWTYDELTGEIYYNSKFISAAFRFFNANSFVFLYKYPTSEEDRCVKKTSDEVVLDLIEIMFQKSFISEEMYENELNYFSQVGAKNFPIFLYGNAIPFEIDWLIDVIL